MLRPPPGDFCSTPNSSNPFLNLHRPCLFANEVPDPNKPGRIKRVYRPRDAMTPLEKLATLPNVAQFLRADTPLTELHKLARALSDLEAAKELVATRQALFKQTRTRAA